MSVYKNASSDQLSDIISCGNPTGSVYGAVANVGADTVRVEVLHMKQFLLRGSFSPHLISKENDVHSFVFKKTGRAKWQEAGANSC